jgi:glutathione S-transferase
MLKIWGRTNSINVQKVMWAVGELGLAHERVDAGGAFGIVGTPEYRKLNPNGLVPTIEDDGLVLWESNAIVRYLAARHDRGGLWPEDPTLRAQAEMWMDWVTTTLIPNNLQTTFWQLIRTPEDKRDMPAVEAAARRLGTIWAYLDDWLSSRQFVLGDRLTIGDIPAGCAYYRYVNLPIDRPALPNLAIWYQDLKERDPFRTHVMVPVT